jgi:hypothetical protein
VVEPELSLLRATSGLADGKGRTVVIAGPPNSGKSDLAEMFRDRLRERGVRVIEVAGSYRERGTPYTIAARVVDEYLQRHSEADSDGETGEERPSEASLPPPGAPPWAFVPTLQAPLIRRARPHAQGRGVSEVRPEEFWGTLSEELRGGRRPPLAILVDNASLVDEESREFFLYLSARAGLRALLLIVVLDDSLPAYTAWDERLAREVDVDRVHILLSYPDAGDAYHVRTLLKKLSPESTLLVRVAALMGGSATPVALGRVTLMTMSQVAEGLRGAVAENLLKQRGERVAISSEAWIRAVADSIPEEERLELHGRIAAALQALYPEAAVDRQLEIAHHLFTHAKDLPALRALTNVAHQLERAFRFDEAVDAVEKGIACAASLASDDRLGVEAALRVNRTRLLVYTGRLEEAERELRESLSMACLAHISQERLEELLQSIVPALRLAGPRPAIMTDLSELSDRFHDSEASTPEVLTLSVLIDYDIHRGRLDKAHEESARVSRIARGLTPGPMQALALLSVAAPLIDGTEEERRLATKCIRSARTLLAAFRSPDIQLYADEIHGRRLAARGERRAAITVHEQATAVAQRAKLLPYELLHNLALASLLLDERPEPALPAALERSRTLTDQLHLSPPSGAFLDFLLLEGRYFLRNDRAALARERWAAVGEARSAAVPIQYRAEAWLRLADLELTEHRPEAARGYLAHLENPDTLRGLKLDWAPWLADLRSRADRVESGPASPSYR